MKAQQTPSQLLSENRVLQVDDLSVQFKGAERTIDAVKHLSFHVDRGETLAIVGESGSGKSVTSLALMRLVHYGGGRVINGQMLLRRRNGQILDLATATGAQLRSVRGADMAMIFQEPMTSLNPIFSVGDQIAETLCLHQGMSERQALAEALHMLDQVRIPDAKNVLGRYPHQLSGGMRQRVMIAMALACKPALLIADEPTTALDVTIQAQILQLIRELQREMNMGVIFITHDMGVVAEVSDRVLVMLRGDKVESGPAQQIFDQPEHPYTRALLAAVPRLGSMRGTDLPEHFPVLSATASAADAAAFASARLEEHTARQDHTEHGANNNTDAAAARSAAIAPASTVQQGEPILSVRDLCTRFDIRTGIFSRVTRRVHAVEKVSFDLFPGETLALVGESGCGKSTTGRSLLRLVESQGGEITFQGQQIASLHGPALQALRRNIQFIFQDPFASLDPRVTVGYSIIEPLLIHKVMSQRDAEKRMIWLLDKVGLPRDAAQRYPHEFSGGQRQRICIARALSLSPKVVIADESVSALDVSIQAQIVNLLIDLQQEMGIAFLFISHDMAVVERVSHRVAVMYLGQIVEMGPRRAIFENPQHPYTKKLMAAVPIADPARRHLDRKLLVGEIPSPIRRVGDEPIVQPLIEVAAGHYVAHHQPDASF
ncbi:dipeptide ABC transporter ATP-binding protein [Allopusillimonas ginsengisoli]|uniref:dipeptide ABC transporter ATP-binding protein n=1 Tax=Allopusillimonas ginsengisoli TaxID=453575 RepID=UPI00101FA9BF|nr:dipeptide ABC transporter ATP-binding protein [Allopusillimonas ginsengisoli]TEA74257.1 dipeptide ABC transporter ATP-binding protein [Allopusillimonas ginsengisoli]